MNTETLKTELVVRISGASPRQLDYWVILGLLRPKRQLTPHSYWRAYTFADTMVARAIKSLREQGVSLQHIREAVQKIQETLVGKPDPAEVLKRVKLMAYGGKVFVRHSMGPVYRAVDRQTTFLFVNFEDVYNEVAVGIQTYS